MTEPLPREAEAFLQSLERSLAALPEAERRDIVAEIRSHLLDRAAQGAPDLLAPFGQPEAYAAAFLEQRALRGALARGSSLALGRALLSGAGRLGRAYLVVALGLLQLVGALYLVLAVAKVFAPHRVGVFIGHGATGDALDVVVGSTDRHMAEILGWWAVPVFLLVGGLALWGGNRALRALAARRLSRLPALRG